MTNRDKALAEIAANILDLETLEARNSDGLDFHELAVWRIKAALEAAFAAGQKKDVMFIIKQKSVMAGLDRRPIFIQIIF